MADEEPPSLADLLSQIEILLEEPCDFTRIDPDSIRINVRVLTTAAAYFNVLALQEFGGRPGATREPGLVEQVIGAASQTFEDYDPHPGPFAKAAMLLRGITAGHPFNDGNKRTGMLTAMYFLELVGLGRPVPFPTDEAEALCLRISAGDLRGIDTCASKPRRLWDQ